MDAYNILLELVEMCLATITTMRVDWCYQIPITQYAFEWNVIFVEFNTQLVQIQVGSVHIISNIYLCQRLYDPRSGKAPRFSYWEDVTTQFSKISYYH